jgi:hypothetical protein
LRRANAAGSPRIRESTVSHPKKRAEQAAAVETNNTLDIFISMGEV